MFVIKNIFNFSTEVRSWIFQSVITGSTIEKLAVSWNVIPNILVEVRKMYQLDANNFTMIFFHKWPLHIPDIYMSIFRSSYNRCHRRNGPNFGRVFLILNYTDITQNTYIQS